MIGNIISAGASILGGLFGKSSADAARESQERQNAENIALQREFAQNGISWKVQDAKNAGVHPLYAIGAQGASFTPSSSNFTADTSMQTALSSAGADIGRAVNASTSATSRNNANAKIMGALAVEHAGLQNEVLRSQLLSEQVRRNQQVGPPMPIGDRYLLPGQAQSGVLVNDEPQKRINADPTAPFSEPGAITDIGPVRTSTGTAIVPSKDVKERIEDSLPYELQHFWRNQILPAISQSAQESQTKGFPPPPAGYHYKYIPLKGEYQLVKNNEHWYSRLRRNWN